ncbi:MAG: type II toxin-antitoxin system Phd/YefM family antitoxin [Candidatus Binatia bacterium]|jgi:prevent-host-death family protein
MKRIALSEARDRLSKIVNDVAHGNERVILESHGRAKAAIVGLRDLERIGSKATDDDGESVSMLRWLEDVERHMTAARVSRNASLEALREVREQGVAEEAGLYRRQRRPQARRRRAR